MKKVLVISTSLRPDSNSDRLALEFARGAGESGNDVEVISLKGKEIRFCTGCMSCMKTKRCAQKDDTEEIREKMCAADVLTFATPIYYYEMSGQMKTLLDRMNPLFIADYSFRDVYLLTCAAEKGDNVPLRAEIGLGGFLACFPKARLAGSVFAGGVTEAGEIEGHEALERAHEAGKNV